MRAILTSANRCYSVIPCLQSKPQLEESLVVDSDTGTFMKSTVRTSLGAQFGRGFDDVFKRIEKRIATVTMIPMGEIHSRQNIRTCFTRCDMLAHQL